MCVRERREKSLTIVMENSCFSFPFSARPEMEFTDVQGDSLNGPKVILTAFLCLRNYRAIILCNDGQHVELLKPKVSFHLSCFLSL